MTRYKLAHRAPNTGIPISQRIIILNIYLTEFITVKMQPGQQNKKLFKITELHRYILHCTNIEIISNSK